MSNRPNLFMVSDFLYSWASLRGDVSIISANPPGAWVLIFSADSPTVEQIRNIFPDSWDQEKLDIVSYGKRFGWGMAYVGMPAFYNTRA